MACFSWMTYSLVLLFATSFVTAEVTENILSSYRDPVHPYQQVNGGEGSVKAQDCPKSCAYRCSETSHKKPCMLYCIQCCTKCLCVPAGTYGGKEECPCYNNWKTQEGKPKCP